MRDLNKKNNTAILLITHDLGVVAEMCDRVVVMYAGKIVEEGTVREILKDPQHPYTKGLIRSLPKLQDREQKLYSLPGAVPHPELGPIGCRFARRCQYAVVRCVEEDPELYVIDKGRRGGCFLHDEKEKDAM